FAERTRRRSVARIWRVSAARPFPNVAIHLVKLSVPLCETRGFSNRMEQFAFDKISFNRNIRRRAFPFELRRQTCARPVGVCVRFEITDMSDRLRFIDPTITGQREM